MSAILAKPSANGQALQRFDRDDIFAESNPAEESSGITPGRLLAIAWRRKWIVLFFLVVGLVLGYIYTSQKVSIYQSSAQVLVIRKRQPTMGISMNAVDSRTPYLDDYIATQLTLLKSDVILQVSAQKLLVIDPSTTGDLDQLSGMLGAGLDVARDKDTAGRGGNVLQMSFRSPSKEKCAHYLEAVIWGYQDFLKNKYNSATQAEIDQINKSLLEIDEEMKQADKEYLANLEQNRDVTDENLADLQKRVSATREAIDSLRRQGLSIQGKLDLIEKVGPTQAERKALLFQLMTPQTAPNGQPLDRGGEIDRQISQLELEIKLKIGLGNSHPEILGLRAKIESLRDQSKKQREGTGNLDVDQFDFYKNYLAAEKKNIAAELAQREANLSRDLPRALKLGAYNASIATYEDRKKKAALRQDDLQRTRRTLESTRESGGYDATVINPPSKSPVVKVEPNPVQGTMMGGVLCLILGLAFASLAEFFDKTYHTPEEIRRRLGRFVIGHVPTFPMAQLSAPALESHEEKPIADRSLISYHDPRSRDAEAVRGLRTSLYFSTFGRGHQVIQVTSPNPGDGKSTITANLAVSVAQSGKKTLLIDADFRKPRVHKLFPGIRSDFGFSSVIVGEKQLNEAIQESGIPNLYILPVGIRPKNPAELLSSVGFQEVLNKIREEFEFVLIDTPPLLAVSDPAAIATRVDGVILVIRIKPKVRPAAERANEMLNSLGANVLGVIVNSAQGANGGAGYGEGYNYGYNYGYGYNYNYKYNYDYEYSDSYSMEDDHAEPADRPEIAGSV